MAPAGVYMVGVAFTLRDILQRTLGLTWTVAAIVIGAALSYLVSPAFALASGAAFLFASWRISPSTRRCNARRGSAP